MGPTLSFKLTSAAGTTAREVAIRRAVIAGWTARDRAAMEAHIAELEELGVARPARTPIFYRVAASRLTQAGAIEAIGGASSGEVEFCLVNIDGGIWVGVGSDHTDREAEAQGVTLSKQLCDKPVAGELWCLDELAPHWDSLEITAHAVIDGHRILYQQGPVTAMLSPQRLLELFAAEDAEGGLGPGDIMMCGTLPAIGGVRPAARFEFALADPVAGRTIAHGYDVIELPVEG
jgi:hypothetical protein